MSRQDGRDRRVTAEPDDDPTPVILHVDMDAFFASVELLEHPELVDQPVVVGHRSPRSVVTAANYVARKYGVNAAMPMGRALQLCPHAIVLNPHFERYAEFSAKAYEACLQFTPVVERASIDESYLDVSGALALFGSPYRIGVALRRAIHEATGLTASVGAATSAPVAKLASSMAKPDGLLVVSAAHTLDFLAPLAVGKLSGVGPATLDRLRRVGIERVIDVRNADRALLVAAVGEAHATGLVRLANGLGRDRVETTRREKSLSHSVTFDTDIAEPARIEGILLDLVDRLATRLRKAGLAARTVGVTLRKPDFSTFSRSRTLPVPADTTSTLHRTVVDLYRESGFAGTPLRLVGVRADQVEEAGGSGVLWSEDERWGEVDRTVDELRARFGTAAVRPATLLEPGNRARPGHDRRDPRQLPIQGEH